MMRYAGRGHTRSDDQLHQRVSEHTGRVDGRVHGRVDGRGHGRSLPRNTKSYPKKDARYSVPKLDTSIMTAEDILFYVLCYVGFDKSHQNEVAETNVAHFKAKN